MASKAYVASMTVAELTSELKQRGLSCRGKKKTLQARLEEALEEEELSESSSDDGREATIRAASAVISQLEGDGKTNNFSLNASVEEEEELVVSIEHSKRGLPLQLDSTRNGNDEQLSSVGGSVALKESSVPDRDEGESVPPLVPKVQPMIVSDKPTQVDVPAEDSMIPSEEPPSSSTQQQQSIPDVNQTKQETTPVHPEPPVVQSEPPVIQPEPPVIQPEPPVAHSESPVVQPEPPVVQPESPVVQPQPPVVQPQPPVVQSEPPMVQPQPPVIQSESPVIHEQKREIVESLEKASEEEEKKMEAITPASSTAAPESETVLSPRLRSPPTISLSSVTQERSTPVITHPVKSMYQESTPDKPGALLPTVMSPMDLDMESEANSIAVEPPSPNRDDISFAVDDTGTSIAGSVELTPSTEVETLQRLVPETGEIATIAVERDENVDDNPPQVQTASDAVADDQSTPQRETGGVVEADIKQDSPLDTNESDQTLPQSDDRKVREEEGGVGVSSQSGVGLVGTGPIEVDVLVPTVEEEDMSVFSAEAAEVQNLDRCVSSKVLERPSTLFESSSANNKRSLSASETTPTKSVGGDEQSLDSAKNSGSLKKRTASLNEGQRQERERSGTPTTKRRKISTSPRRATERRRKWGSSTSRTPTSSHTAISSDVLETIIPDDAKEEVSESMANISALEAVMNVYGDEEMELSTEQSQQQNPNTTTTTVATADTTAATTTATTVSEDYGTEEMKPVEEEDILDLGKESSMMDEYEQEWKEKEREREEQKRESQKAKQELETRRRIEARVRARQQEREEVTEKPVIQRTPSPARNPPSRILHIENLTRPFTNNQLKDLLQDGDNLLVEGGCWTDRIKSHCIAVYVTMDSAIAARNRIHNLKWPRQNPRLLKADYITTQEVQEYSNGELEVQSPEAVESEDVIMEQQQSPKEEKKPKAAVAALVDEQQQQRRSSRSSKENAPKEANQKKRLSSSDTKDVVEEEKEAKPKSVLDNLFRKTKATPPIYWLPLSETEAEEKESERKAIEAEREKRREERQKERDLENRARERRLREEREERAKERMRRRERSRSRSPRPRRRHSSSGRYSRSPRRRSRSPRRRTPIKRIKQSRSPVQRRRSRTDSYSPVRRK